MKNKVANREIGGLLSPYYPNKDMITLHYFANLRETLGTDSEELIWQQELNTVTSLKHYLSSRANQWSCFSSSSTILTAINQKIANDNDPISDGDEIAFFPPVTGG